MNNKISINFWRIVSAVSKIIGQMLLMIPIIVVSLVLTGTIVLALTKLKAVFNFSEFDSFISYAAIILFFILIWFSKKQTINTRFSIIFPPMKIKKHERSLFGIPKEYHYGYYQKRSYEEDINNFIACNSSGYGLLVGGAGLGKTSIMESLASETSRDVYRESYFFRFEQRHSNKDSFYGYLIRILIWRFGIYTPHPADTEIYPNVFIELITSISNLHLKNQDKKLVIYIDALDELSSADLNGNLENPLLLPRPTDLPEGVFIIISTRPTSFTEQHRFFVEHSWVLSAEDKNHKSDVYKYVCAQINNFHYIPSSANRKKLCRDAKYNFMLIKCLLYDEYMWDDKDLIDGYPTSLNHYYERHYRRMKTGEFGEENVLAIFCLSNNKASAASNFEDALDGFSKNILTVLDTWKNQDLIVYGQRIQPYHKTYREFLGNATNKADKKHYSGEVARNLCKRAVNRVPRMKAPINLCMAIQYFVSMDSFDSINRKSNDVAMEWLELLLICMNNAELHILYIELMKNPAIWRFVASLNGIEIMFRILSGYTDNLKDNGWDKEYDDFLSVIPRLIQTMVENKELKDNNGDNISDKQILAAIRTGCQSSHHIDFEELFYK